MSVAQGGTVGLLSLVVLMVLTGKLLPRSTYQELRQERDDWRAAAQAAEALVREQQEQIGEMLELSRTAGHVLTSLPGQGVTAGEPVDQAHAPQG